MLERIALRASSCRKRTYLGSTSSRPWRSGSSAASGHSGMTASSTDVRARLGTTETSSISRRACASRRDTRPSTAFVIDGGRSVVRSDASSSVT